ncbi:MAG: hypothetical protein ACO2XQ_09275, partial [Flavobacteriales bacterium]
MFSEVMLRRAKSVLVVVIGMIASTAAWSQTDVSQVVRSSNAGGEMHIWVDHYQLLTFSDSVVRSLDAVVDGQWNGWSDVLANQNSPGVDVDFDGYNAYGVEDLTCTGTVTSDSLVLNKDAVIAGVMTLNGTLSLASGSITDSSGAISFGDENLSTSGTAATGNLTVTGTLSVSSGSTFNGTVDINADLDVDATDIDLDATNDISLDAGAASNFTTSAGGLTLAGAAGVTVTSTGGTLALNGAGQTVDLDATTLDID